MLTSLPFQLVVLTNTVWSYFVVIVSFITLIAKGSMLLYPSYALALEFIGWICYSIITFANLRLNSLGNFTENYTPIFLSLPFLTLMLGGTIYYLFLQVYVLMFEVIINSVSLLLIAANVIASIVVGLTFVRFAV